MGDVSTCVSRSALADKPTVAPYAGRTLTASPAVALVSMTEMAPFFEECDHFRREFIDAFAVGVEHQFGFFRRLVGIVDSGEPLELARAGLFVKTFGIAFFAGFQRRVDVDFDELYRVEQRSEEH